MSKILEEVKAMFAESDARFDKRMAESDARFDKRMAESDARFDKRMAESRAEFDKREAKSGASMEELKKTLNGIGISNGMVAEEYFYESLCETKTFGGVHYDDVETNWRRAIKLPDKTKIQGQYDIVMINDESVCLIETKYRVRPGDAQDLADRQVANFKLLFPDFAGYKYYLGIGGWCFEDKEKVEAEAKRLGVGVLKLNGDAVVIHDDNLKVY